MKLVHYKLRKEHQMQKYSTIIGVIELRQSGIGYRTTKKRYNIGNSTVTLIMNRFHELGISLEELKAMPPKKVSIHQRISAALKRNYRISFRSISVCWQWRLPILHSSGWNTRKSIRMAINCHNSISSTEIF